MPTAAFGSNDHEGLGYITLKAFLENKALSQLKFNKEDITTFFHLNGIFKEGGEEGLSFQKFRQIFFPTFTISGLDQKDAEKSFYGKTQEEMLAHMKTLENNIRIHLKNNYTSVRKAFLDLDQNRDGLIEPTDLIKRFGHMFDIQYDYL